MVTTSPLGSSIPPHTAHAISVSLPTWGDVVGYEEGERRVIDAMKTGYPRFFIHLNIQKLARISEEKFGSPGERCLLFPSNKIAASCRAFLLDRSRVLGLNPIRVRLVQFLIRAQDQGPDSIPSPTSPQPSPCTPYPELHIVLFPADIFPLAKEFWQHTGTGISSRLADFCLSAFNHDPSGDNNSINSPPHSPTFQPPRRHPSRNKHYAVRSSIDLSVAGGGEILGSDQQVYLEERYGRNKPISLATSAKRAMRLRIAGVLRDGPTSPIDEVQVELGPSMRGVKGVTEDDVYLFPTGMSAIWNAHQMVMAVRPPAKSVCFGFPYMDTLKILQKWGEGCYFLGHGLDSSLDELEALLDAPTPIQSLFTEFPSNPLLRSADLPRIRALADKYGFLVVVDETIGNFANVQVLPWADVVVSSLSKVFSGDSNVMGGSLVLNPAGRYYAALKAHMEETYEDTYYAEDAVYMERNSRDFAARVQKIDTNTEILCDWLHARSLAATDPITVHGQVIIKNVCYPKWETRQHYDRCRTGTSCGFGGLFSLTFTSLLASRTFFDALRTHKGPSLGTNFTLACPYTILAHYGEMEWAEGWGVESGLVRVSVGMESGEEVKVLFEAALQEAARRVGEEEVRRKP